MAISVGEGPKCVPVRIAEIRGGEEDPAFVPDMLNVICAMVIPPS